MKHILIMRHAKSDWNTSEADFDRPLNRRGKKAAPFMGEQLLLHNKIPDRILSSPALRAKTTTEKLSEQIRFKGTIQWHEEFYHGYYVDILRAIQNVPETDNCVLIVGHNPTLEDLIRRLLKDNDYIEMPTATIVSLTSDLTTWKEIDEDTCTLEWVLRPRELQKDTEE